MLRGLGSVGSVGSTARSARLDSAGRLGAGAEALCKAVGAWQRSQSIYQRFKTTQALRKHVSNR